MIPVKEAQMENNERNKIQGFFIDMLSFFSKKSTRPETDILWRFLIGNSFFTNRRSLETPRTVVQRNLSSHFFMLLAMQNSCILFDLVYF